MKYSEAEQKKILMFPTIQTLTDVAHSLELTVTEGADRVLIPWKLYRLFITFTPEPIPALVSIAQLRCDLPFEEMEAIAAFVSNWNSERISPTASVWLNDQGSISIQFVAHYPIGSGASFEQVADFIARSCDVSEMAMSELASTLREHVYELHFVRLTLEDEQAMRAQLLPSSSHEGDRVLDIEQHTAMNLFLDSEQPPALFDEEPSPVTIEAVADAWRNRGIENMDIREEFIVTGINNILMAAFLDNGPSLLLRGHWDCSFPEDEQLKAFLIINDWNKDHPDSRALWVTEDGGLQLRVECAYPVTHGLTPDQLDTMMSTATQAILSAIDTLSREISGSSPVHWPDN